MTKDSAKDVITGKPAALRAADDRYRYPGIKSFDTDDAAKFFGRDDDGKKLANRVEIEKHLLLYSRSGLGKSSLLKASLIPKLTDRGYQTFYIRFGYYLEGSPTTEQKTQSPVQKTLSEIAKQNPGGMPETFLKKFPGLDGTLWHAFKAIQAGSGNARPAVLIFDQFEELNTYPEADILEFKKQLAELLFTEIPGRYLRAVKESALLASLNEPETEQLYQPLRVRAVFSIRSDMMSLVDNLSDYLPNILKATFELLPLTESGALEAITKPARLEANIKPDGSEEAFATPKFDYEPDALLKLLNALNEGKSVGINSAQLQILLQFVERELVLPNGNTTISAGDLGKLEEVYEKYYQKTLKQLPAEQEQYAKLLIEEKLIISARRILYDGELCLQEHVTQKTLDTLIDVRLLNREPNRDGFSYEVSHDSLVAPILESREERRKADDAEKAQVKAKEELKAQEDALAARAEEQRLEALAMAEKKKQQRKLMVTYAIGFFIMLGLGIWALISRHNAVVAQENADKMKLAADTAKAKAVIAQMTAEKAQKEATKTAIDLTVAKINELNSLIEQSGKDNEIYEASDDKYLIAITNRKIDSLRKNIKSFQDDIARVNRQMSSSQKSGEN